MKWLESFIQTCHEWSLRRMARRIVTRLKRSVKRRMKGESHRQWMERNLHDSEAGILLDITQSMISVMMVVSIIDQNWLKSDSTFKSWYQVFDVANLLSIFVNFSFRLYAASNRKGFFLNWLSLIDICTAIPLFLQIIDVSMSTGRNRYLYRFLLMIRTIRILQLYRLLRLATSAKARQGLLIGLTIMCIIICAAVTFQTIEHCDPAFEDTQVQGLSCQNLSFLDSIYFVCITIGTVGYGDFVPKTKTGKMMDILLIVIAGGAISTQLGGYTDIVSRETAFDKKYVPDKRFQHILLCGEIDNGALRFFLHTWLNAEGERGNRKKVIILAPTLPSNNLRRILLQREYEQRVVYLQGSAMVTADLQRAAAPSASYCFIMVKKHSETLDQNDTAANLLTCSVRKNNRHAPLYVQVSKFDNARHVNISGASAVLCLEQLRLAVFGKSLWIKGLNAFLGNLIQRFAVTEESSGFWLSDYLNGCSHRIYEATLPHCLFSIPSFRSLAILIYREFSVPVIGLRTIEETAVLFPVDKDLSHENFQSIFIIAKSKDIALRIEKLTSLVLSRHIDLLPNIEARGGLRGQGSAMTEFLTAIEGKLPFRGMSITVSEESRSMKSARSTTHQGSRSSLRSIGRQRSKNAGDKITPLQSDDDYGDPKSIRESMCSDSPKGKRRASIVNFSALPERGYSVTEDDDGELHIESHQKSDYSPPVIALSPAELMKKASSPYAPPTARPPGSAEERGPIVRSARTPQRDNAAEPPSSSSERSLKKLLHLSLQSSKEDLLPKRATIDPSSIAIDSPSERIASSFRAPSQHDNETGNGHAAPPLLTDLPNGESAHENVADPDHDSFIVEAPVIRRKSSKVRDPRLRRISMFRSFRRKPPPNDLANHFVVCGTPSNYSDFLANLSDLDEPLSAVVFVTPRDLNDKDFQAYQLHKDLYFVRGSPVSMQVFHEARMLFARSILIMSYCATDQNLEDNDEVEQTDENMADVDAITTHRFISEACQNSFQRSRFSIMPRSSTPYVVAEMIRPSNAKFLVDRSDSLYDEKALENDFRKRELLKDTKCIDDCFFSPLYASGHIYFTNAMDALMGSCSQHTLLIDMFTQLIISGNMSRSLPDHEDRARHRLSQVPAPIRFHFRPYALMVEGMLEEEDMMVLGLYRGSTSHTSPAFVFTNPAPEELVTPHDLVFVIL